MLIDEIDGQLNILKFGLLVQSNSSPPAEINNGKFKEVKELSDEKKISYREACLYLGVKRIIDAMMARGRV